MCLGPNHSGSVASYEELPAAPRCGLGVTTAATVCSKTTIP